MPIVVVSAGAGELSRYVDCVSRAGGSAKTVRGRFDMPCRYDALLLTGGGDPVPQLGGYACSYGLVHVDEARDYFESWLYCDAVERGAKILGVCRGAQVINCLQGGTLHGDIARDAGCEECHQGGVIHPIHVTKGSLTERLIWYRSVNSYHHQAVAQLGAGLKVGALSPGGIVEAVEHVRLPIIGLQWHPERMNEDAGLWTWLVSDCK